MLRLCLVLFGCLLLAIPEADAKTESQTLYINRGKITAVDSSQFAYAAFNKTNLFDKTNALIRISEGDSLVILLINNDTVSHRFSCQGQVVSQAPILASDTAEYRLHFPQSGLYIYFDSDPIMNYLGLAGMISVEQSTHRHYYWNISEHNKHWNDTLTKGYPVNWSDYYPDYFLINGNSNPHINQDSVARVKGNVGDTILICISNTGRSVHSLHLHGYHGTIVFSSGFPHHQGRSKDTFPVFPMQSVILQIVPDKPGEYPVHDHNLVAVSGGNYYPNGMFLTLLIQ